MLSSHITIIGAYIGENLNASRPSEHQLLGGIIGCKNKTSSWNLNGFLDGSSTGSTV